MQFLWLLAACSGADFKQRGGADFERRGGADYERHGGSMTCGAGVSVCGVLALMTGLGSGVQNVSGGAVYGHPVPMVHGLWPEVPPYGDSKCVQPVDPPPPALLYTCYACPANDTNCTAQHQHLFEQHEWAKHGVCAQAFDADTFFRLVCALSKEPLQLLTVARRNGIHDIGVFAALLSAAGYEVFSTDAATSSLLLSACVNRKGDWLLAPRSDFERVCGG